jgi:soluble lytic murein transglycosylase-like protein
MSIDSRYQRDERLIIWMAVVCGAVVGVLACFLVQTQSPRKESVLPEDVWRVVSKLAPAAGIDPGFVYALAWAESGLNARARSSVARGIMQLTKPAWMEVTDESYRLAWDWQTNIRVGIDYLAFCRDYLKSHDSFNYQLLAASYRYGPYYVRNKNFDLKQVKPPKNKIYQNIFAGNIRPVAPPAGASN